MSELTLVKKRNSVNKTAFNDKTAKDGIVCQLRQIQ